MAADKPRNTWEFVQLKRVELAERAIEMCKFPKSDPFDNGVAAGKWQGASAILDELEVLLKSGRRIEDDE